MRTIDDEPAWIDVFVCVCVLTWKGDMCELTSGLYQVDNICLFCRRKGD